MKRNGKKINSARYTILEEVGQGCWGVVYLAKDRHLGQNVAIKAMDPTEIARKQMKERGIDELRAVEKEAGKLAACSNVVPRRLEFDDDGTPFLVMPVYDSFFSNELGDNFNERPKLGRGLTLEGVLKSSRDIARGLSEMHTQIGRAHGDLKADNIAKDRHGKYLLNDLGTSTCITLFNPESQGSGARGFVYTRAPECFSENQPPTASSDVWAFGSLLYRQLTGEYLLEKELSGYENPADFFRKNSPRDIDRIIRAKIKKAPRKMRGLLRKTLACDIDKRIMNGSQLEEAFEHTADIATSSKSLWRKIKTWTILGVMPLALMGGLAVFAELHEPKDIAVPRVERAAYQEFQQYKGGMTLVTEEIPSKYKKFPPILKEDLSMIKLASDNNQNVAYLLKTYFEVVRGLHLTRGSQIFNDTQFKTYHSYTPRSSGVGPSTTDYDIVAKNIGVGLWRSRLDQDRVDLEDVCAIARVGEDLVNDARRASQSWDYSVYRNARDADGKFIIPAFDRLFIERWIAQVQQR